MSFCLPYIEAVIVVGEDLPINIWDRFTFPSTVYEKPLESDEVSGVFPELEPDDILDDRSSNSD